MDGTKQVKLFGEEIQVHAHIEKLVGISGHADKNGLLDWLGGFEQFPKKVFVVHGEDAVCDIFADTIHSTFKVEAAAPFSGTVYDLATGACLVQGMPVKVSKKAAAKRAASVFERLLAAGRRLMLVINHNEGGANKDLARFTDQINQLCDKWDR